MLTQRRGRARMWPRGGTGSCGIPWHARCRTACTPVTFTDAVGPKFDPACRYPNRRAMKFISSPRRHALTALPFSPRVASSAPLGPQLASAPVGTRVAEKPQAAPAMAEAEGGGGGIDEDLQARLDNLRKS